MPQLFSLLVLSLALGWTAPARAEVNVQSFQAWKSGRVDEARASFEKLQGDQPSPLAKTVGKTSAGAKIDLGARLQSAQKGGRVDQKLQQAQLNLDVAQELTINDYFVLYLSQFKSRESFIEAAKKLNPDEAADLMMSYQKHLNLGAANYDDVASPSNLVGAPVKTN